jgi:PAS domain S-box-containing protein
VTTSTDRGRSDASLARFRQAFDSAPIGISLVGLDGTFLLANRALCAMVGYAPEELSERGFAGITHPDDVAHDLDGMHALLAGEIDTYEREKRYVHKRGRIVWAMLAVSLVRDESGEPLHFVSQALDVTERRRAQLELERSERDLAEAQRIANIGSWYRDLATGSASWSDELYRIFGVEPGTDMGLERFLAHVHPDDRARFQQVIAGATREGVEYSVEYRIVTADGEVRWVHARGAAVHGSGGVVAYRGTAQDVTDQRRSRAELERSRTQLAEAELQYRTLVEHLPLTMFSRPLQVHAPNLYVSPQVEQMLGYPAEEWMTDPGLYAKAVHPEDRERVLAAAVRLREEGAPFSLEYRFVKPDGGIVWVADESYLVHDAEGKPLFVQGFLEDITRRKLAEADRDQLQEELLQAQKLEAVGRLAGGIAHDFNNMLTAIKGYGELLLARLEPGGDGYREALQVLRAAEQAATLPRQLLAFSRNQVLEPRLTDLNEVVADASDLLRRLIGSAIELEVDPAAHAPVVLVDAAQLEQVLVNLALNARDAMPSGGTLSIGTENVRIPAEPTGVPGPKPGDYVVVTVDDTGEGMDDDTRAHAFEPFFTTRSPGLGTGLGLASVHGVVSQSGGFIRLESSPGAGTTVALHFPCAARAVDAEPPGDRDTHGALAVEADLTAAGEPRTVLLAEDEELVRGLAVRILEQAGFTVHAAASGSEALELHDGLAAPVDLLVTDMVMPGLNGRALAERLRSARPELPVVFMSGYSEEAPTLDLDGDGVTFLAKPFPLMALVEAVEQALA